MIHTRQLESENGLSSSPGARPSQTRRERVRGREREREGEREREREGEIYIYREMVAVGSARHLLTN